MIALFLRQTPSLRYICKLIDRYEIDLIHAHELPGLIYGFLPAKLKRLPFIYTKHGIFGSYRESKIIQWIEKVLSRRVTVLVSVSGELTGKIISGLKVSEDKLVTIYNGIETPPGGLKSQPDRESPGTVIGSVGRLAAIKNYPLLIRAFERIIKRYPDCRLEIVGDGECREELERLIEEKSLSEQVTLHGFKVEVEEYLGDFDIFVLPSLHEGHSISLLEALRAGRVCLVSDVGGNTEIIEDGRNGFLFRSGDMDNLTSRLSYILDNLDTDRMEEIRHNAYDTFTSDFSVDNMISRHEVLYRKHLEG